MANFQNGPATSSWDWAEIAGQAPKKLNSSFRIQMGYFVCFMAAKWERLQIAPRDNWSPIKTDDVPFKLMIISIIKNTMVHNNIDTTYY